MPSIKNKLNHPVVISLADGKSIGLLPYGSAAVNNGDLASPHLKGFIERGEIVILPAEPKTEKPVSLTVSEENEQRTKKGPGVPTDAPAGKKSPKKGKKQ